MKYFLTALCFFTLTSTPLQAETDLPISVVESYHRLMSGSSLHAKQDWEQVVSFAAQNKLQHLIEPSKLLGIQNSSIQFLSPETKLILMKWVYEEKLFQLNNWVATEEQLVSIASFSEDIENTFFQRWALSRIALLLWLDGNVEYSNAYKKLASSISTNSPSEVWFNLFLEAVNEDKGAYTWLKGARKKSKLEEGYDFLSLPNGEWLSFTVIFEKLAFDNSLKTDLKTIFSKLDRLLPESEYEQLAPYIATVSKSKGWNLDAIYLPGSPTLELSKKWLQDFEIMQTKWQMELERINRVHSQEKNDNFLSQIPIPLPWLVGLGGFIGFLLLTVILRKLFSSTTVEQTPSKGGEEQHDVANEIVNLKPTDTENDQPTLDETYKPNKAYEASPKLVEESAYKSKSNQKEGSLIEPYSTYTPPKNYRYEGDLNTSSSRASSQSIQELPTVQQDRSKQHDFDERKARLIVTLQEAQDDADFNEIWAMIKRFIDKEFPQWFEQIEKSPFELTEKEVRYLSMMMLEMENELISSLAKIKKNSFRGIRSRIRKKLGVSGEIEPHLLIVKKLK